MPWGLFDEPKENAVSHDDAEPPWWLESGAETCQSCQRTFHYEAGYHCFHCDSPVCPVCVVELHETRQVICPECHAQDSGTNGEDAG